MSWIKDNQFIVVLSGITLVGAAALIFVGLQGSSRYTAASEGYQEVSSKAATSEGIALYPTSANKDGKRKAVSDYRDSVMGLQSDFTKFRPAEIKNIAPQEFTNNANQANTEVTAAFTAANTVLPPSFFVGFETYTTALARESATGILDYQLGAAKEMFLSLAKARPTQLINFHRTRLPEEDGGTWKPAPTDVFRPLSFEVSFKGSEKSAREFLTSLAASEKYYYVIRSLRIANEKRTPPLASDGKFEPVAPVEEAAPAEVDNGGFVFPTEGETPAAETPAAEPAAPAAPAVDTGRILSQVLGNEDIYVFVRFDVLQFLPVKELPQP